MSASAPTLLLVEDDPNDVFLFEYSLERLRASVPLTRASDGEEAIRWLDGWAESEAHAPLLVVLDLKLPRRSGLEVLAHMRSHPVLRSVPVVVLTSSAEASDTARAHAFGVERYHVKPVGIPELETVVRDITSRWFALAGVVPA
jgi:hypothetical protein